MRDKEEGWKRRMREGRGGGRKDDEEGATRRVKKCNNYKGPKVGGAGREMETPQKSLEDPRGSWKSLRGIVLWQALLYVDKASAGRA